MSRAVSARAAGGSGGGGSAASSKGPKPPSGYFERAELPLTSLAFLLPLIVLHEVGVRYVTHSPPVIAFHLLERFFNFFGATGRALPAMAVVGILFTWHIARHDRWEVHVATLFGMLVESFLLALPLLLLGFVAAAYLPLAATTTAHRFGPTSFALINPIGAGIYEELVFRLIGFTVLNFLFLDILAMRKFWAYLLIVLITAVLFSSYHYLGPEPFQWQTFVFRTLAGLYFGAIFVFRGFGITAGSHASYDITVGLLRFAMLGRP